MRTGRPRKYQNGDELWETWLKYLESCNSHTEEVATGSGRVVSLSKPLIPSVEGFCFHADITRETLSNYGADPEFLDAVKKIREEAFARKHEALVNGKGSTVGLIFDMKANYGLVDKQVIDQNITSKEFHVTIKKNDQDNV